MRTVEMLAERAGVDTALLERRRPRDRKAELLEFFHRGRLVATHPVLPGKYQLKILPEHGPGAIARNVRQRHSSAISMMNAESRPHPEVEVRDLALYEALARVAAGEEEVRP